MRKSNGSVIRVHSVCVCVCARESQNALCVFQNTFVCVEIKKYIVYAKMSEYIIPMKMAKKNMLVCGKRQKNNLYVKMARYIMCIVKRSKYTEYVCEKSKIKPILLHN